MVFKGRINNWQESRFMDVRKPISLIKTNFPLPTISHYQALTGVATNDLRKSKK